MASRGGAGNRSHPRVRGLIAAVERTKTTWLAFLAIWIIGLIALTSIVNFENRIDTERRAQVVVETMQRQVGDLIGVAFNPALATGGVGPSAENKPALAASKQALVTSLTTLSHIGSKNERLRIDALTNRYFLEVSHLAALVSSGHTRLAAIEYGRQKQSTGAYGALFAELRIASDSYSDSANYARRVGTIGTIVALLVMLLAFSLALARAIYLAREKHELLERSRVEAMTDSLTGLSNRRKLFADMELLLLEPPQKLALGMYDLDGFKAYNDAFGHPAGDALLARVGHRLALAVAEHGSAYRIGGDEFCVMIRGPDPERVLSAATAALSEQGSLFNVTCSHGSVTITSGEISLEQALQQADQRLYDDKRSGQGPGGQPRDVLLSVLAEQSQTLAAHMLSVGRLASAVAEKLGLSRLEIARTCLAAELHDIGKTAIPDSILGKAGPLDDAEWEFIKRHTIIGERILAATASLADVAPVVRWSHERPDGSGYPDGLRANQIPLSSRIVAVVDAYDAMTSTRPYSPTLPHKDAVAEIRRCIGSQFDPAAAEALIAVLEESYAELLTRGRDLSVSR